MYDYKMKLTAKQTGILNGAQGETMAKVMETIVMFGDMFGAERLVPVTHNHGHLVTSFGLGLLKPLYATMDKLVEAGIKVKGDFTIDPRPVDFQNVPYRLIDKFINSKILYTRQKRYEEQLRAVGIKDENAFTCACYLPEVGNTPKEGDILSWAESSAVVFANSVLGARCNRNWGCWICSAAFSGWYLNSASSPMQEERRHGKSSSRRQNVPKPKSSVPQ